MRDLYVSVFLDVKKNHVAVTITRPGKDGQVWANTKTIDLFQSRSQLSSFRLVATATAECLTELNKAVDWEDSQ